MEKPCTFCGTSDHNINGPAWWSLNNYFGITGYACPDCYKKVSHDAYKNPNNPEEYLIMRMKHG